MWIKLGRFYNIWLNKMLIPKNTTKLFKKYIFTLYSHVFIREYIRLNLLRGRSRIQNLIKNQDKVLGLRNTLNHLTESLIMWFFLLMVRFPIEAQDALHANHAGEQDHQAMFATTRYKIHMQILRCIFISKFNLLC